MWPCWVTQISSLNNLWTRGFFCYIWHFLNRIYSLSCWLFSWAMEVNVNINKYKNGQTISSACDSCVQIVSVFVYIWSSWKMCKTNFHNEQIKASCLFLSTYPCQTWIKYSICLSFAAKFELVWISSTSNNNVRHFMSMYEVCNQRSPIFKIKSLI